jgi:uncharacterized membrane protein
MGGVLGTLSDSLLGAAVQGTYHCDTCGRQTEQRIHGCGRSARLTQGIHWIDNDVVNLLATGIGAGATVSLAAML